MTDQVLVPAQEVAASVSLGQEGSDGALIELWLNGLSPNTRRAYGADVGAFLAHAGCPLRAITLGDIQTWACSLAHLAPASRARKLAAVKSLLTFGNRIGYLPVNAGLPVRMPAVKNVLAERILEEADVVRLIALETHPRDHALLRLLYLAGLRISEACGLRWRDARRRAQGGQITVFGKGGKTRVIALPAGIWKELAALRDGAPDDAPLFASSRGGGPLDPSAVHRVVKHAAKRAGLPEAVSAHWLRHACASHALDRSAPVHVVQQTLGHASLATTSRYAHARPNDSASHYLVG